MVLSALDPAREAYHLWRRFSMPTHHGARDAISVPAAVADQLNSAYTFMLQMIIISFWSLLILAGVVHFLGRDTHSHNSGVISTGIWNAKGSPFDVSMITTAYLFKLKDRRRWLLLLWTIIGVIFLVTSYAVPIKVAPFIIIGNAAPVAASAIYVPSLRFSTSDVTQVKVNALQVPSALRAAGAAQVANAAVRAKLSVDSPTMVRDLGDGEAILRMGYRYNITGLDLGLQDFPDLILNVEGSCQTDYDWLIAETVDDSGIINDEYLPFDDPTQATQNASLYDSARPLGYFMVGSASPTGPAGNFTWGAIVSSVQRLSFSAGTDPWYLTAPTGDEIGFIVTGGRPALSCWQNDVWSYHGHQSTIVGLNPTNLPGLNLSPALQSILIRFLGVPEVPTLGTRLGASSLVSADTALGEVFDAGSSSAHADLERLVFASYIASMNVLTDTTLFSEDHNGIPNDIIGSNGEPEPGVDDFVIWGSQIRTLSVKALIIIPVITLVMFLAVYLLTNLPFPWYRIQALQATVLYSCLHEKSLGNAEHEWNRTGNKPYVPKGDIEQGIFRPRFDLASRTLSWGGQEHRGVTLGIPTPMSPKAVDHHSPVANGSAAFPFPEPQVPPPVEKVAP